MDDDKLLTPREKAALAQMPEVEIADGGFAANGTERLVGVSGFLAFLVVVLIFLSPLFSVVMAFAQQQEAKSLYPELVGGPGWQSALILDWSMISLSTILGIVAGLLLLKRFKRSTVWIVICLIWISSVGVTVLSLVIADVIFPNSLNGQAATTSMGRPLMFSIIWTLYLLISRRVKRTYPKASE